MTNGVLSLEFQYVKPNKTSTCKLQIHPIPPQVLNYFIDPKQYLTTFETT